MKLRLFLLFFIGLPGFLQAFDLSGKWVLQKSEITYRVVHPLHEVTGKSASAKGKGVFYKGSGQFLVAVPVKSFESGDNNRDLHMLEITRAGTYPMVVVNVKMLEAALPKVPGVLKADVTVDFAGQEKTYPRIDLNVLECDSEGVHLTGTLPLTLKDFGIQAPSLLAMPIHDDVPVNLDMVWQRADKK